MLSVLLMAAKFGVPVWPHAGGVGLCEYVQHLSIIDYVCVSGTLEDRLTEYADHLHEHFVDPLVTKNGRYMPPKAPGYSITMKEGAGRVRVSHRSRLALSHQNLGTGLAW